MVPSKSPVPDAGLVLVLVEPVRAQCDGSVGGVRVRVAWAGRMEQGGRAWRQMAEKVGEACVQGQVDAWRQRHVSGSSGNPGWGRVAAIAH